jgi:GDP-L-fucose synthase
MPSNLYGPGDNYNLLTGHALPSLIRKFHEAKVNNLPYVEVWGTGKPKREFLYVEDLALALIFLMKLDEFKFESILSHEVAPGLINVGYGKDESIRNIAQIISETIGYDGKIVFNKSFPDGTFQKLLDNSKITSLGWVPETSLKKGISLTYKSFLENPKPRDIRF